MRIRDAVIAKERDLSRVPPDSLTRDELVELAVLRRYLDDQSRIGVAEISAVISVVIAGLSFMIMYLNGTWGQIFNISSIRPYIRFDRRVGEGEEIQIAIVNAGAGPAIVQRLWVTYAGAEEEVKNYIDLHRIITQHISTAYTAETLDSIDITTRALVGGDALSPGEQVVLCEISGIPREAAARKQWRELLIGLRFDVRYESIFGSLYDTAGLTVE